MRKRPTNVAEWSGASNAEDLSIRRALIRVRKNHDSARGALRRGATEDRQVKYSQSSLHGNIHVFQNTARREE